MSDAYFLPPQTEVLINKYVQRCQNLGLVLDKYVPQETIRDSKNKGPWLKDLVKSQDLDPELLRALSGRWQTMLNKFNTAQFTASLAWRMVLGLGGESVLETDITLHHIYGIPCIPGSALKGLTRAYAAGEDEKYFVVAKDDTPGSKPGPSPKAELDHEVLQRIFGSQERAGTVLFFDALPTNGKFSFVVDIMNPHYPDYYNSLASGNKKPPTNDQSPNPVMFITVAEASFTFALAFRDRSSQKEYPADLATAQAWLEMALQKYGVGGKTSAGYGFFNAPQRAIAAKQIESEPYVRPNMPRFSAGQGMDRTTTIAATDELKRRIPEAQAFLRYREFSTRDVLIVVEAEEATNWTPGQTKNCLFVREEVREGCTVLFCQVAASKKKKR